MVSEYNAQLRTKIDDTIRNYVANPVGPVTAVTDTILTLITEHAKETKPQRTRTVHRDAVTGKFLSKAAAENRPNTSFMQTIKRKLRLTR